MKTEPSDIEKRRVAEHVRVGGAPHEAFLIVRIVTVRVQLEQLIVLRYLRVGVQRVQDDPFGIAHLEEQFPLQAVSLVVVHRDIGTVPGLPTYH